MDEAFYRLKSAGGAWTRVTGPAPITVTGLTGGAVYEYLKGDGTIGEVTAGVATVVPSITASDSLSGRDLTISVDSLSGTPAPTATLTALTLNGADVLGDATGTGPWQYSIPDSAYVQTFLWTLEATNPEGTESVSGVVAAFGNLGAPTATAAPTISGTVEPGETVTLNEGTYGGTTPITISPKLTLDGVDVTGDVVSDSYTIPTGTAGQSLVYTETASNGTAPDAVQSASTTVGGGGFTVAVDYLHGSSDQATIRIDQIDAATDHNISLSALNLDGTSVLGDVTDADSPQMAATTNPGTVSGGGSIVSALLAPLEVDRLYLVSYEVTANPGANTMFFPAGNGSPFPNGTPAPATVGRHNILVRAEDTDTAAILRVTGEITFGHVSCRQAEWVYDVPSNATPPETATTTNPGTVSGGGSIVSALTQPLEVGGLYLVSYEITDNPFDANVFFPENSGSPFTNDVPPPSTVGRHNVLVEALDTDVTAMMRVTGEITFGYVSCRKATGAEIEAVVMAGSATVDTKISTPNPGVLYVAPWGPPTATTGGFTSPFVTPSQALAVAGPDDTIILRPGIHPPFEVTASGASGQPLVITAISTEVHQAVVQGDLQQHVEYGGPGVAQDNATRDGVWIVSRDHIHVRNLTIRNLWRHGIRVEGTEGEQHGGCVFANNLIEMVGASGISVWGRGAETEIPATETTNLRLDDILIEHNDVSQTNVVTDYQGESGGVVEAISVGASASNVITRFNDVHDTRQYGIDYKSGVRGGAIYDNRVWKCERYGIYLDSARRFVEDIAVYNNRVWACRVGITLSREAGSNTIDYDTYKADIGAADFVQTLKNIDIYNNLFWDIERSGIYMQRHPQKDGPDGEITDIRVRFNTVHNANLDGSSWDLNLSGWADADFLAAGVVSNFDFIGNIVSNDTAAVSVRDEFSGQTGFIVTDNLIGVDPFYSAPDADPPDLSLDDGSPAFGLVPLENTVVPFNLDVEGDDRTTSRAAGAYG